MNVSEPARLSENTPWVVPVLSTVISPSQIPPDVMAALDARALEHAAFMALANDLVQGLRPELERMTTELVQQSLRQAWAKRFRPDMDGSGP